jgi:hypothetical protein
MGKYVDNDKFKNDLYWHDRLGFGCKYNPRSQHDYFNSRLCKFLPKKFMSYKELLNEVLCNLLLNMLIIG